MSDVQPGQRFGAWCAVKADPTGRKITVVCVCGLVAQIAREVLESGENLGCGCRSTPRQRSVVSSSSDAFARDIALLEQHGRVRPKYADSMIVQRIIVKRSGKYK